MATILETQGLSKNYGSILAVNQLSLQVEQGGVFGILGPNGSGKTTTLGMILGVLRPSGGSYRWFEEEPSHLARKRIGALLEAPNFYPYLSAYQNLKITADIKGVPYPEIDKVLHVVNLYERKKSAFSTYSTGMKQRLAIAAALLGNPEVLVLDEPTNGLDPQGIAEVRDLIIKVANEGRTILLASHLLDEVEKVCTHVAVLKTGNLLAVGSVKEILSEGSIIEVSADNMMGLQQALQANTAFNNINRQGNKLMVTVLNGAGVADLNKYLLEQGITVTHLSMKKKSLESLFLELTKN